jgi:hypothetical protein
MTPGLRVVSRKDRSVQAAVNNGCLCDFYVSCTHIDDPAATELQRNARRRAAGSHGRHNRIYLNDLTSTDLRAEGL